MYVCTGCDYTSFFSLIGKTTFLQYLFWYAVFITGRDSKRTLADTGLEEESCKNGFLAFLVQSTLKSILRTCFETPSPVSYFQSLSILHIPQSFSMKTGWRTFAKAFDVVFLLKTKWYLPMKPYSSIGSDPAGFCTLGDAAAKSTTDSALKDASALTVTTVARKDSSSELCT